MALERRRIQSSDLMLSLVTLRIWFVWSILVTSGIQRNCRRKRNLNIQPECTVQEITPTSFRKHRLALSTRHQKKIKVSISTGEAQCFHNGLAASKNQAGKNSSLERGDMNIGQEQRQELDRGQGGVCGSQLACNVGGRSNEAAEG